MKQRIVFIIMLLLMLFPNVNNAEENGADTNEVIASQSKSLGITEFLQEAQNYESDILEDTDISQVLTDAIKGDIETKSIGKKVLQKLFKEMMISIASIGSIIVIVVIHSILKNISDGLENSSTSQITYFVTYILIVTIVMKNFADIIIMVQTSIDSLIGFINCLLPILITLMLATRKYCICWNVGANNTVYNYSGRKYYK